MFRPYEQIPANPPPRPVPAMARAPQDVPSAAPVRAAAPLPSNWDQMDLDQRVRSIGEW